jgi:predicted dehydrogenase
MSDLKVGIVGCGLISLHKYIPGFKKAGVKIASICDLNEELVKKVAKEQVIPKSYTDLGKMLNEDDLDLVSICTPPGTHAKLGLLVLQKGLHLLMEKPMALTVSECDVLIEEAKKRDKKICVGHSDLFYPSIIKARELLGEGRIGEFRGMRIFLSTPVDYALAKKEHWIHKLPGGILGETGPHVSYLTAAFVRKVNEVKIMTKKNFNYEWTAYDDIRIELKGENGISSVVITHSTNQWDAKIDIFGSNKNLYIDMHEFLIQEHNRKELDSFTVVKEEIKKNIASLCNLGKNILLRTLNKLDYGHELLIKKFVESIQRDTPSPVSPEDGKEAVRIMEMIVKELQ